MDFSVILVLPFSAMIAFAVCVGAAVATRPRPRLIWPFGLSTAVSAPVFVGLPQGSTLSLWLFVILGLALWAAIGTVIGGILARMTIAVVRLLRSNRMSAMGGKRRSL